MNTYVAPKPGSYRSMRILFIIGLLGLILAASGVIWLLVEFSYQFAQIAPKAALYTGSWSNKQNADFDVSKIVISNNGLNIAVHVFGNCSRYSDIACDLGTFTQQFTGGPLTISLTISNTDTFISQMTLSSTNGTQLKVELPYTSAYFVKT